MIEMGKRNIGGTALYEGTMAWIRDGDLAACFERLPCLIPRPRMWMSDCTFFYFFSLSQDKVLNDDRQLINRLALVC